MLRNVSGGGLPSEYQQVEWIRNPNNEYIKTDFIPNDPDIVINCEYHYDSQPGDWSTVFGAYGNLYMVHIYRRAARAFRWGNFSSGNIEQTWDTNHHEIVLSKNGAFFDGVQDWSASLSAAASNIELFLFCQNYYGDADYSSKGLCMESFSITKNGVYIINMIPCYHISDGIVGMYDLARNRFFYSNRGGNFEKGADVN